MVYLPQAAELADKDRLNPAPLADNRSREMLELLLIIGGVILFVALVAALAGARM